MKKFLSVLITISLLIGMVPIASAAIVKQGTIDGFTWTLDDQGTLTIDGTGVIPETFIEEMDNNVSSAAKNLIIGEGVTGIGGTWMFAGHIYNQSRYKNLETVSLPSTFQYSSYAADMTETTEGPFGGPKLREINVSPANPDYTSVDGIWFSKDMTRLVYYPSGKQESDYIVPSTVTRICNGAFDMSQVENIYITGSVTELEYGAFELSNLKKIYLPASITSINDRAFCDCHLTDVYYGGTQAQWDAITIERFLNSKYLEEAIANATIHYNAAPPVTTTQVSAIGTYANQVSITKSVSGNKIEMTIQPLNNMDLSNVELYVAEYNDGILESVKLGTKTNDENGVTVSAEIPGVSDYNILLWDELNPMTQAIK